MIEIGLYEKSEFGIGNVQWRIELIVDGLSLVTFLNPVDMETDGKWNETKAQAHLQSIYTTLLGHAQDRAESEGLVRFNRDSNQIEFAVQTKRDVEINTTLDEMKKRLEAVEKATGVAP